VEALRSLQQLSDFDSNPDMADDTFLLISRAIRYSPGGGVLNAQMLPLILQASMASLLVEHMCFVEHMHVEPCAQCSDAVPGSTSCYGWSPCSEQVPC